MKLFTKADNAKLFANYSKGSDMANQNVVVKIFNPYGRGTWFIMNSDPNDPDYLWGIVDLGQGVEVGSISRSDLENYRNRFGWRFERDTSFSPKNAREVLEGLRNGEFFAGGGEVEFIEYGDSEIMFEPNYKKYYANDMEFDSLEEAKKFIDSGEIPQHIRDAYAKGLFAGGGGVKRKMALSDSVIYQHKVWYITEKNGVVGLMNFKQGAWGSNYPFVPLSRISQSEITDMMGREVEIPYLVKDFATGGSIPNNYAGRTPENVWDNLSKNQRSHFLYDHMDEIQEYKNIDKLPNSEVRVAINSVWMSLDKDIKNRFANHVREGQYKKGGALLSPRQRYIAELKGLTGLQQKAIEDYIDENNLTSDEILHIVIGLGRKQISRSDVSTAIVGKKNNAESKKLLAFAMSDSALKAEYGAFMDGVYAGGGGLKKYILRGDIKEVWVKRDNGIQFTFKGSDVLNGANFLAKGDLLTNDAIYLPKRNIMYVILKNGNKVKPTNGYWIKKDAKGELFKPEKEDTETMSDGGKTTFAEKSSAIAKNFVGKSVEPKYQKQYGKRYDAKEAKEVGNKIAGKQKATYDKKNMKRGGSTKQASRMTLLTQKAKEIRKEGEAWRDALKRANAMMK